MLSGSEKVPKGGVTHLNFHLRNAPFERVKEHVD